MATRRVGVIAKGVIVIYLLISLAAFIVAVTADDSLGPIFLVTVAMPWTILITWITDIFGTEFVALNYALMILSILLNATAMYLIARWWHR